MSTAPLSPASPCVESIGWLRMLLAVAIGVSFFSWLGAVPLFDLDEGAFTEATREMLLRRDFVSTWLNGAPRFDKPILIYWLQAASVSLLGQSEWAFRLPSALCATAWVLIVWAFVRRVRDERTALLAAIITATAAGITVIGRAAIADALLNALIVATMASCWLHLTEGGRRWLYAAMAAVGLGLLAKGPVAVLVPLAVTALYCLSQGQWRLWLRTVLDVRALALMVAIAAPWYLLQYQRQGDAFIQGFFMKHNVSRFSAPMHGFDGSLFFYLPWLLVATLPYTAVLIDVLRRPRELWSDPLRRYCLIWFGFVLVFFSLSGTKLPHYVFYGYTGLFILMALGLDRLRSPVLALLPAAIFFALCLALPELVERAAPRVSDPYYREAVAGIRAVLGTGFRIVVAGCLLFTLLMMGLRRPGIGVRLLICGVLQAGVIAAYVLPAAGEAQQSPIREAALIARDRPETVVMWGLDTPSFIVYSGRLVDKREPRPGDTVLTKRKRLASLPPHEVLFEKNGIALVKLAGAQP